MQGGLVLVAMMVSHFMRRNISVHDVMTEQSTCMSKLRATRAIIRLVGASEALTMCSRPVAAHAKAS